jgi:hypothetical protein
MGQASVCSGYFGDHKVCEAEPVKELQAKHVEVFPSSSSPNSSVNTITKTGTTTTTSTKTAFRTPSQMLKDLKEQEGKKTAQERWAKTKAEWEANLIADIEERERSKESAPGTEADRFGVDERQAALEAIREEEEMKRQAEAGDTDQASEKEGSQEMEAIDQPEKVEETIEADAEVTEKDCEDISKVEAFADAEAADGKASVDAFLAKNGFDGVNAKRHRALRPSICPLHLAAEKGDTQLISALLKAGADKTQKDSQGRTPEDIARKKNRRGSHDEALAALASV